MFKKKNKTEGVDYQKLNEGIQTGTLLLKIFLVLSIVILVYVVTRLLTEWKVWNFVGTILSVISPLFIGIVIAWLFDPIVKRLNKKGVNRTLGAIFVYVIFIAFIYLMLSIMIPTVYDQLNDLISSVPSFLNYLKDSIDNIFVNLTEISGYDLTDTKLGLYHTINNLGKSLTVDLPTTVVNVVRNVITGGANLLIGFLIGLYMLFDFNNVKGHLLNLIPKKHRDTTVELLDKLNGNLKSYVHGTLRIMLILFVFQSIALAIAGLKAPMIFGLFCAITNVIPYIGPYIGGIPAILVGFSMSPMTGICTLVAIVIAQFLESNFLQPLVMGKTMKLHPVTIMIGLLIFGHFFGILGMIFATPIIAVMKTIFLFFNEKFSIVERMTS